MGDHRALMLEERFLSRKHPLIGYFHRAPTFSRRHFLMSSQSELDREKALRSHPLVDWSRAVKHDAGPKVLRQTFSSFGLTSTQAAPTVATLGVSTAPTASTAAASARPTAEAGWSVHYSSRSLLEAGATAAAAADDRLSVSSGSFSNSTTPQTASRSRVSAFSTTSSPESPTHDRLTRSSRLWAPLSAAAPLLEGVTPVDDSDDERDLSLVTPPRLVGTASLRHGGMVGVSTFGVSTFGGAWSSRGSATLSAAAAAADSALPVPRCTRSFADLASLACDPGFGGAADDVGGDGLGLDVDWGGDGEQDMGTLAAPLLRGGVGPDLGADSRTFEVRESSSSISSASDADVHGPVIVPGLSVNATVDAPAPSGDLGLDKDAEGDACFPSDAPVVTIGRGFGSGSMPVVCGRPNSPSMVWEPLKRLFVPRLSVDSDEGTALMLEAASRASSSDGALSSAAASSRAGASSAVATASSVWGASSAVPSPRTQAKTNGTKGRVTVTAPVTLGLQTVFDKTLDDLYSLGKRVGAGNFGEVFFATSMLDGSKVAVKRVKKSRLITSEEMESISREVSVHLRMDHPHIIHLQEVFETDDIVSLVLERAEGRDLQSFIDKRPSPQFSEAITRVLFQQLFDAIDYIHNEQHVIHCDLKPDNILFGRVLNEQQGAHVSLLEAKICDFGNARPAMDTRYYSQTRSILLVPFSAVTGTMGYIAPEILSRSTYNTAVDMWSLGVLLFQMLGGYRPFMPVTSCLEKTVSFPASKWSDISPAAIDLCRGLLQRDPAVRYTARQARNHPWITKSLVPMPESHGRMRAAPPSRPAMAPIATPAMPTAAATSAAQASAAPCSGGAPTPQCTTETSTPYGSPVSASSVTVL